MTTADSRRSLRRALQIEKLRNALTGWMSVSDADVAAEFRKRNEKVKLDVVPVTAEAFVNQVTATDAEIAAAFEKSQENIASARSARSSTRCSTSSRCARRSPCPRPTSRRSISRTCRSIRRRRRCAPATSCSSSKARTKSRSRRRPKTLLKKAKARRGLRGARQAVFRRRQQQRQRRRPRLLRPRPHGGGIRAGRVRDEERRDQQPGQDGVRLPHHQDGG